MLVIGCLRYYIWQPMLLHIRILNCIRTPIFSSDFVHTGVDSGMDLVLSILFILVVVLNFYNFEANDLGVVWCSKSFMCLQTLINKSLTW